MAQQGMSRHPLFGTALRPLPFYRVASPEGLTHEPKSPVVKPQLLLSQQPEHSDEDDEAEQPEPGDTVQTRPKPKRRRKNTSKATAATPPTTPPPAPPRHPMHPANRNYTPQFTDDVKQMMFVSGETGEVSIETTTLIEQIVHQQVVELVRNGVPSDVY